MVTFALIFPLRWALESSRNFKLKRFYCPAKSAYPLPYHVHNGKFCNNPCRMYSYRNRWSHILVLRSCITQDILCICCVSWFLNLHTIDTENRRGFKLYKPNNNERLAYALLSVRIITTYSYAYESRHLLLGSEDTQVQ